MKNHGDVNQLNRIILLMLVCAGFISCGPNTAMNNQIQEELAEDSTTAIIKGTPVSVIDHVTHSTVSILRDDKLICTGTLINKSMIITAGHCKLMNENHDITVGFSNKLPDGKTTIIRKKIIKQIVHPRFLKLTEEELSDDTSKDWNDISVALFEGESPANYNSALLLQESKYIFDGQSVTIAGYGLVESNQYGGLDYAKSLMKANILIKRGNYSKSEFTIKDPAGKGACHGDSGGPVYISSNLLITASHLRNKLVLAGVTSRSISLSGSRTCKVGSVQTSVPANMDFIKDAIKTLAQIKAKQPKEILSNF